MLHFRRLVRRVGPLLVALVMLQQTGCANHIFKKFNIDDDARSISVDAKQRMVLVTHKGGKTRDRTVVCTEPSPDSVSALALSGSLSGSTALPANISSSSASQDLLNVSSDYKEKMTLIAMRSQTIQLLRDGLFRACEAYMNGAIDQHQYNVILLNIDRLMVNLIGVDAVGSTNPSATVKGGIQSEAMTNIVMSANAHSSVPSLCISLLASGELRNDNPGQAAVLSRCDYLLAGTMSKLLKTPPHMERSYQISPYAAEVTAAHANTPVNDLRELKSKAKTATTGKPPAQNALAGNHKIADWSVRIGHHRDTISSKWAPKTTVDIPTATHQVTDDQSDPHSSPQVPPPG